MDHIDMELVRQLQQNADVSARELGNLVGLSATPCWRRVKALEEAGVIDRRVAIVDPERIGLAVNALVSIRTNDHSSAWIKTFRSAVDDFPEIVEAYRTSGEMDYQLSVRVTSIAAFDAFYQRLVDAVPLHDVRSTFVMEHLKHTTELPLNHLI